MKKTIKASKLADGSLQTISRRDIVGSTKGASLVEYALLISLISVVVIFAVTQLGTETTESYQSFGDNMAKVNEQVQ